MSRIPLVEGMLFFLSIWKTALIEAWEGSSQVALVWARIPRMACLAKFRLGMFFSWFFLACHLVCLIRCSTVSCSSRRSPMPPLSGAGRAR